MALISLVAFYISTVQTSILDIVNTYTSSSLAASLTACGMAAATRVNVGNFIYRYPLIPGLFGLAGYKVFSETSKDQEFKILGIPNTTNFTSFSTKNFQIMTASMAISALLVDVLTFRVLSTGYVTAAASAFLVG